MRKKAPSQRELISTTNKVNNNPHSIDMKSKGWDDAADKKSNELTLYDSRIDKVIDAFRKSKEATLNRIVSKREPGEPIKTQNQKVDKKAFDRDMEYWRAQNRRSSSQFKLKHKNKVPKKDGKPMWEDAELMNEDLSNFITAFRKLYSTNKTMTFRKWIAVMEDMLDMLE